MNHIYKGLLLFVVGFGLFSCSTGNGKSNTSQDGEKVQMVDAKGFTITKYDGYKVVDVVDPWKDSVLMHRYILVDRKASLPDNLPDGDVVRVPVAKTSCLYSVFVGTLDMLGVLPTVVSVAEDRYIDNNTLKAKIAKGQVGLLGEASAVDVEALIDSNPEIILVSPFKNMGYGKMEKVGIPIVEVASYMEATPLGRAEWIKFIAVFYGKEALADSIYTAVSKRYNRVKAIAQNATTKPTVFAEKKFGQVWNMPGGNSYMGCFFRDAGANYLWSDINKSSATPLSFEAVYQKAEKADFWLVKYNKPKDMTYNDLKQENEQYAMFQAFKMHKVIHCNTQKISYYEQGVMEPDVILADLVKVFHPNLLPEHNPVYFQLMSK